jgi:hypothetical protein
MFHEITSSLWSGMLSAESSDALGKIEKARWTRSSTRLNGMLKKLSIEHETLLLSSSFTSSSSLLLYDDENTDHHSNNLNPLSNLRFKYVIDRTNSKHAQYGNNRWDPYDGDSYLSIYPTFRLKFPEHIIITKKNIRMYVGVHRLLFFANIVSHALRSSWMKLKISERSGASLRWLHILRHRAHHVVRSMQEQTATSLHEGWSRFYQRINGSDNEDNKKKDELKNVVELRSFHTEYVEEMATSCFVLDTELRQLSFDILSICLRCAHIITLASKSNRADPHLKTKSLELNDDLSMLLKKFINIMSRHNHRSYFVALILSLRSVL